MKKRILSLILCISMISWVLVGCGGNSSSENTEQNTQQSTEQDTQISTELDTETVTEQVKYYSVSEEDLEYSLYKVWNLLAQYDRALITKEIYGECPNSPKNFAMGCKTYKGNLTILQETNKDIIFSQNFVSKGSGGYSRLYNDLEDSIYYLGDVQVFVDVVATNFEGSFVYKEGTKQVIKVVMDFHAYSVKSDISEKYNDDTYDDLYVIYFTKEAGNTDVWLIDYMQYYAPEQAESGHWNIDDSRYLNAVLAQEDFTLLINENSDEVVDIDKPNIYLNAYIEYMKENFGVEAEGARYNLLDLDNDGIKELVYSCSITAAGMGILSYYNGFVVDNHLESGVLCYLEGQNKIYHRYGRMGYYGDRVGHLENGNFVVDIEGSYSESVDENGELVYKYDIDGETVSYEEYNERFGDISKVYTSFEDWMSFNELVNYISNN